jgi:alpha-beta hydrolase superfamily lysophospholipase
VTVERVTFANARGHALVGDLRPGGPDAIVIVHGFTGDRHEDGRLDRAAEGLSADGFTTLTFDFAGSGESDDVPITLSGEVEDLRAALAFIRGRGARRVGVLAFSLGALVTARVCATDVIDAIVFWSPVSAPMPDPTLWYSPEQLDELERTGRISWGKDAGARRTLVIDGQHLEERRSFDRAAVMGAIPCPVLVLHGSRDEIVPVGDSRTLMALLKPGSRLKILRRTRHIYGARIRSFLRHTRRWFRAWQDAAGR